MTATRASLPGPPIWWLDDEDLPGSDAVGGKAAALHRLRRAGLPVVDGFVVPVTAFELALAHNGLLAEVGDLVRDIDVSGFELVRISLAIGELVRAAQFPADLAAAIEDAGTVLGSGKRRLAVRSSATVEDLADGSCAGIYASRCDVDPAGVLSAIREVWASLYGLPALYHRKKHGLSPDVAGMAVIVQQHLDADDFGVLFTRDPLGSGGGVLEWSPAAGRGADEAAVTDGGAPTCRLRLGAAGEQGPVVHRPRPGWVEALTALGWQTEALIGCPADVEWARSQDSLFILQARPITARCATASSRECSVVSADDQDGVARLDLAGCAGLHGRWWAKHRRIRGLAREAGVDVARCLFASYTKPTVDDAAAQLKPLLRTPYLFVDVSDELRSIVVRREELAHHLSLLLGGDDHMTVRVRECHTEHASLLSGRLDDGSVLVEHTPGGIKGLIRGLSAADRYQVTNSGEVLRRLCRAEHDPFLFDPRVLAFRRSEGGSAEGAALPPPLPAALLREVADFSRTAATDDTATRLEWSVFGGTPCLLDHSVEQSVAAARLPDRTGVMSSGAAHGTALVLHDLTALEYISDGNLLSVGATDPQASEGRAVREILALVHERAGQGPLILVAQRPLTALALLIDDVAGFVFEDGALLCHLAILLREAGKPAVLSPGATSAVRDGMRIEIGAFGGVEFDGRARGSGAADAIA